MRRIGGRRLRKLKTERALSHPQNSLIGTTKRKDGLWGAEAPPHDHFVFVLRCDPHGAQMKGAQGGAQPPGPQSVSSVEVGALHASHQIPWRIQSHIKSLQNHFNIISKSSQHQIKIISQSFKTISKSSQNHVKIITRSNQNHRNIILNSSQLHFKIMQNQFKLISKSSQHHFKITPQ